jgi:hypothetical protein
MNETIEARLYSTLAARIVVPLAPRGGEGSESAQHMSEGPLVVVSNLFDTPCRAEM